MVEIRLRMVLGSSFKACGEWLESLCTQIGSLFGFRDGLKLSFSRLN